MRLGIDASNLLAGGGLTHLANVLGAANPQESGFSDVILWGGQAPLDVVEARPWLKKVHEPLLDRSLPARVYWQMGRLARLARAEGCSVLFSPGGRYLGSFRPCVTMFRNMLPFAGREASRYHGRMERLRFVILRRVQVRSFRRADGLILLTQKARAVLEPYLGERIRDAVVIPHGVHEAFRRPPDPVAVTSAAQAARPLRILYVSSIVPYKHHVELLQALDSLRSQGESVVLEIAGAKGTGHQGYDAAVRRLDPCGRWVSYLGLVPHKDLPRVYHRAELFAFVSSCEVMPNILIEAMAAGLPIACSDRDPMPDFLGDAGVYFDPEDPEDIARAIRALIADPALRAEKARLAYRRALAFSWDRCARETMAYLADIAQAAMLGRAT